MDRESQQEEERREDKVSREEQGIFEKVKDQETRFPVKMVA